MAILNIKGLFKRKLLMEHTKNIQTWKTPSGNKVTIENTREFDNQDVIQLFRQLIEALKKNNFSIKEIKN